LSDEAFIYTILFLATTLRFPLQHCGLREFFPLRCASRRMSRPNIADQTATHTRTWRRRAEIIFSSTPNMSPFTMLGSEHAYTMARQQANVDIEPRVGLR